MRQPEQTKRALVVVRTYPVPEEDGVESSCTAAITDQGEWLRLFPVPYRYLPQDQRFQKYQWIEVTVIKSSDPRPESYKPREASIKILTPPLSTDNNWKVRKDFLYPLRAQSLCSLRRQWEQNHQPTLGFFRPKKIDRLLIDPTAPNWTPAQLAILRQEHLFLKRPSQELEKIPFWFRYAFTCDDQACTGGHVLMCADWEIGESYRSWKREYGKDWEAKFRQRYETEMLRDKDTHFFVGTLKQYPWQWIIVGLFYPPLSAQGEMFAG
jgi:hypothetical protein